MKNGKFSFSKCGIELGSHNLRHMLAGSNDIFPGTENLTLHTVIASLHLLHKTEMCQVFVPCSLAYWIPRMHNDAVQHKNKPCNLNNYVSVVSNKPNFNFTGTVYTRGPPYLEQSQPTKHYRRKLSLGSESMYSLAARLKSTVFHILNTVIILASSTRYGQGS